MTEYSWKRLVSMLSLAVMFELVAAALLLGPAGAPAEGPTAIKGWLEPLGDGTLAELPRGVRPIEFYGRQAFVEVSRPVLGSLAGHGVTFRPVRDADILHAGGERFDVRHGEPEIAAEWRAISSELPARRPFLVKFDAPIKPSWTDELLAAGAEIVQYQPHFAYLILAPPGAERRLRRIDHLVFHGEYHAAYKARAELRARASGSETMKLRVVYFDLPDLESRIEAVESRGARVVSRERGNSTSQWARLHYVVYENVRAGDLQAILRDPGAYWAEKWSPPQLDDERAAQITAGNIDVGQPTTGYHTWLDGLGSDGNGVTVAVADTGLDTGDLATLHEDLRGRVTFAAALCANHRDRAGHGTNVAAIALGDPRPPSGTGLTDPGGFFWGTGTAPGAWLYFQKALDGSDCGTTWAGQPNTLAEDAVKVGGSRIGSHSFTDGGSPSNGYSSGAQAWDARVRDADTTTAGAQPYAVLFSSGNSGPGSGSLTSPKAAKNIITVGATDNYRPGECPGIGGCGDSADDVDAVVDFSSRGPTNDGRFKPDVVAPGNVIAGALSSQATYSCVCDSTGSGCCSAVGVDGSNSYTVYSGTSQAVPLVAGASAVVFDWFNGAFGSFPSPAMNKAILINGAVDVKTPDVPNNDEGWGRVDLGRSLQGPAASEYVDQTFVVGSTGDPGAFTASYFVQDPGLPLKTTLVWTDPPGSVNCDPCLVNDLDLFLTQTGTTWQGNNFTAGFSNTGTVSDTLNNVEGIHLPGGSLSCASFDVKVRAQALNGDGVPDNPDATDQDFALVVSNAATTPGPPIIDVTSSTVSGGCDGDAFLDRKETVDLALTIGNGGCATANGVQATVSVDSQPAGASVTVSPSTAVAIGSIAPGAGTPQVWQVGLADDPSSFCGEPVTLRVELTDNASGSWTGFVELVLDGDNLTPMVNTDDASTDNSDSKDAEWSLQSCRVTSASTSWHMGQTDCTGIVRDASTHDLVFAFNLQSSDRIKALSFQHAFQGYSNASNADSIQVQIDPEDDGSFVTLQSWQQGLDNPTSMTPAGPYDLTPFEATRGNTVKVRFRFASAANWVGPNMAAGWDVDDIVFEYEALDCDPGTCVACSAPSGLTNNNATDANACLGSGVDVSWSQDPADWGDGGSGTRTFTVLRDGAPVPSGSCSGALSLGMTSCTDDTAVVGVSYDYQVRYDNGCGSSSSTTGVIVSDLASQPQPVSDGSGGSQPLRVDLSGSDLVLTWEANACATGYNLYAGDLGSYWSHEIFTAVGLDGADSCMEPGTSATFADPGGDLYFLVSADNGILEGNLGASTPQDPRPYATTPCSPH